MRSEIVGAGSPRPDESGLGDLASTKLGFC